MDEIESHIQKLRQSIEAAKRLKRQVNQSISDLDRRLKKAKAQKSNDRKQRNLRPDDSGELYQWP